MHAIGSRRALLIAILMSGCADGAGFGGDAAVVGESSPHSLERLESDLAPLELVLSQRDVRFDSVPQEKYTLALHGVPVLGAGVRVLRRAEGTEVVRWLEASPIARSASITPRIDAEDAVRLAERSARLTSADLAAPSGALAIDGAPIAARHRDIHGAHPTLALEAELEALGEDTDLEPAPRSIARLRLTWRVELFEGPDALVPYEIAIVDAQDGELVRSEPAGIFDQAIGLGFFQSPEPLEVQPVRVDGFPMADGSQCLADITRTFSPVPNTDPCGPIGAGIHTFIELPADASGPARVERAIDNDGVFGDNTFVVVPSDAAGEPGRTTAADAHFAIGASYDFFREQYGRLALGVDNSIQIHTNSIDVSYIWNAAWVHTLNGIVIGQANLANRRSRPAADPEWLGHEYTHSVVDAEIGVGHTGEFPAIEEGMADVFGVLIDARARQTPGTGYPPEFGSSGFAEPSRWVWGDRIYPNNFRYFDRPSQQAGALDAYVSNASSIDSHLAGGIMRRAFYFMAYGVVSTEASGGTTALNTSPTYLPRGVTGIGAQRAARLLYQTIVEELDPRGSPTFAQMRGSMTRAAARTYGYCSSEYKTVEDSWAAVNVGAVADRVAPTMTMSPRQDGQSLVVDTTVDGAAYFPLPNATLWIDGAQRGTFSLVPDAVTSSGLRYRATLQVPVPDVGDGTHRIEVRADDGCNNQVTHYVYMTVDAVGPSGVSAVDVQLSRDSHRRLRIAAADPAGVASYIVDVGPVSTGTRFPSNAQNQLQGDPISELVDLDFTGAPNQFTEIRVTAVDGLGNRSINAFPYLIDHQAPSQCALRPWASTEEPSTIQVIFDCTDDSVAAWSTPIQRMELDMNGSTIGWADRNATDAHRLTVWGPGGTSGRAGQTLLNMPVGVYTFDGRGTDSWGNVAHLGARFVMTTPPTLSLTRTIDQPARSFRIDARAQSPLSTVRRINFYEDGHLLYQGVCDPPAGTCSATFSGTADAGTTRTIEARTWDAEGRQTSRTSTVTMPECPSGQTMCSGACRSLLEDEHYCGSCTNACLSSQVCANGVCVGDGPLRFTMTWDRPGDMDLHVVTPGGYEIYFSATTGQGGQLDRDDLTGTGPENIFWSGTAPRGTYLVCAIPYNISVPTSFSISANRSGAPPATYSGSRSASAGDVRCSRSSPYFVSDFVVP